MVYWEEFRRWRSTDDKYLPIQGEGDTMATQITTAVSKLVYKWYNDGDVFDNTGFLEGWCNDLSSYANWLWTHCDEAKEVLERRWFNNGVFSGDEYEDLLYELCEKCQGLDLLDLKYDVPAIDSIYECDGPFRFVDNEEENEW